MKKAKIALTAITVLGIVGGALAFKAKSAFGQVIYTESAPGQCDVRTPNVQFGTGNQVAYDLNAPGTCAFSDLTSQEGGE